MGPSPLLCFLHAKQQVLDLNYKSLCVPDLTCRLVHAQWRNLHQNDSLYEFQPSPVVLRMQNSVISTRITSPYEFQPSFVVLCIQNSDFRTRIACLYASQTSPVIFCMQNIVISIRITSLYGSPPSSVVFACKQCI